MEDQEKCPGGEGLAQSHHGVSGVRGWEGVLRIRPVPVIYLGKVDGLIEPIQADLEVIPVGEEFGERHLLPPVMVKQTKVMPSISSKQFNRFYILQLEECCLQGVRQLAVNGNISG